MRYKWRKHIIIFLWVFALCAVSLYGAWKLWFDPYRGTVSAFIPSEKLDTTLTGEQAVEDLDYLVGYLEERHPACVKGLPHEVEEAYNRERREIIELDEVEVLSLWQRATRIFAKLGDAHTAVGVKYEKPRTLPLSFKWEEEILRCDGGEYDGYAVVQIGGIEVAELYRRFLTQFSYELESWAGYSFATRLNREQYLSFVGVDTQGNIPIIMESPDGTNKITLPFELGDNNGVQTKERTSYFDYRIEQSNGVGIFTLWQCVYDEEYKKGLKSFFTAVEQENIHSVIVDLRGNPGGNSLVANEFVGYLPTKSYFTGSSEVREGPIVWKNKPQEQENERLSPMFEGDVYVLTATDTFSSAVNFATLIADNKLGKVVGEIPGNMPSSYGDILYFQTPNAGLIFTVSHKYFVRPDATKSDFPLIPDVQVPAEDALEEVMELIYGKSME